MPSCSGGWGADQGLADAHVAGPIERRRGRHRPAGVRGPAGELPPHRGRERLRLDDRDLPDCAVTGVLERGVATADRADRAVRGCRLCALPAGAAAFRSRTGRGTGADRVDHLRRSDDLVPAPLHGLHDRVHRTDRCAGVGVPCDAYGATPGPDGGLRRVRRGVRDLEPSDLRHGRAAGVDRADAVPPAGAAPVVAAARGRRGARSQPMAAVHGAERLAGVGQPCGGHHLSGARGPGSSPSCSRGPSVYGPSWVGTGSAPTRWRWGSRPY